MQKTTRIFNITWMLVILFSTMPMQGMKSKHNSNVTVPDRLERALLGVVSTACLVLAGAPVLAMPLAIYSGMQFELAFNSLTQLTGYTHTQLALHTKKYNENDCLLTNVTLPEELISIEIFPHCLAQDVDQVASLENSIKNFMKLRATCKKYNTLLTFEIIGGFCKKYAPSDKNSLLYFLLNSWEKGWAKTPYLPASILICAGANANTATDSISLLEEAVHNNNAQLVTLLFKHNVDPNTKNPHNNCPVLCRVKTIEIAQMFIDNGVDIHATSHFNPSNVLWYTIGDGHSLDLITFYLKHHVDANQLDPDDNSCLLHALAKYDVHYDHKDIDNFLKKARILLNAMPHMVNALNNDGQTPVDVAQESFKDAKKHKRKIEECLFYNDLAALIKKHGGFTAQELATQKLDTQKTTAPESAPLTRRERKINRRNMII